MARNTAVFSILTGFSRVAGLVREVVAARYYGTSGPMSAFTIAFAVPNLIRALFADAALGAAFVPVFTELLERKQRKDAIRLASALGGLILAALGAITALFMLLAPVVMPLFTGDRFTQELDALTSGLARVMFPIVVLLGFNGLVVGILNAHDHFSVPALAPVVWNLLIIAALIGLQGAFGAGNEIYAYAVGVLAGTVVQLLMCLPVLRRVGFPLRLSVDWRDPRLRKVLILMLPVTIGLGLINFNLLINAYIGSLISVEAPAAIDRAFRIYMLPQGMFSVAVATVLFPVLSRFAARGDVDGLRRALGTGNRQIALLLVPAAAATLVLAEPITRLVYERGAFDAESTDQAAEALFWFSFSLPFSGVNLLLTRTFFSLQSPWTPTALAGVTLAVNVAVSAALYGPLGIGGVVLGTVASTAAMTALQAFFLRDRLRGLEAGRTLAALLAITVSAAALAVVALGTHAGLEALLGGSFGAQVVAVGTALAAGSAVYAAALLWMGLPEASQVLALIRGRLRRSS